LLVYELLSSIFPRLSLKNNPLSKQRKGDPLPPVNKFSSNPSNNFNAQFPLHFQQSFAEYMKAVSWCQGKSKTAKNEIFLKEMKCHS
jgi:hypothetical protein